MKNFLKACCSALFVTLLSLCIDIEGRGLVRPIPVEPVTPIKRVQPITPVSPVQPVIPVSTAKQSIKPRWTKKDPEIVNINKSVKIINNQQDCTLGNWNNNPDDACQCCLTYGKDRFGDEQSADQIINHCTNVSKQCTQRSIENIKKKYNA